MSPDSEKGLLSVPCIVPHSQSETKINAPIISDLTLSRNSVEFSHYDKLKERIRGAALSACEDAVQVSITDTIVIPEISSSSYCSKIFRDEHALLSYFKQSVAPFARTIEICAKNSISPLNITESCLEGILSHHSIHQSFWDIVASFRSKPGNADAGFGSMITRHNFDDTFDMQYTLTYAEESCLATSTSWTLRQVGVFNHVVPPYKLNLNLATISDHNNDEAKGPNVLLLLHPKAGSMLQNRLLATAEEADSKVSRNIQSNPFFTIHLLVLSTYFPAWRFYLSHLNDEMESIADVALTLQLSKTAHYTEGYAQLRKLKHLEDKVLPLAARFQVTLGTVQN